VLTSFVRDRALQVLGLRDAAALDDQTPLGELGLDSLLAVDLGTVLGRALDVHLPATLLFDYPTVDALSAHLWQDVLGESNGAAAVQAEPVAAPTGAAVLAGIADMSDDEVDRLLAARRKKGS
jgi:acyl carrier protein